jgi:HAD superfamily hydrolase (TIGR01509 family)
MRLPAAVIFDNDGLTLDTEQAWTRAEVELFARHGSRFTIEHKRYLLGSARDIVGDKLEELLRLPGHGAALAAELHELAMTEIRGGAPPLPGARELVAELRAAGVPVGLASNSAREFVDVALLEAGMAGAFDATLSAEEVARPKPAPDVYLAVAERLGADPRACVALEDSQTGVAAARAAGMLVIGIPSLEGVELAGADVVAGSLTDPAVRAALGLRVAA